MNHSQFQHLLTPLWRYVHLCDCNWRACIDFSNITTQALVFPSGEMHRLGRMSACEYVCVSDCPSGLLMGHLDRLSLQLLVWPWLSMEAKTSSLMLMGAMRCAQVSRGEDKNEIMQVKDVLDILRKWFQNDHSYRSYRDRSIMEKIYQGSVEIFFGTFCVCALCVFTVSFE